jgi:hypothetical protein
MGSQIGGLSTQDSQQAFISSQEYQLVSPRTLDVSRGANPSPYLAPSVLNVGIQGTQVRAMPLTRKVS